MPLHVAERLLIGAHQAEGARVDAEEGADVEVGRPGLHAPVSKENSRLRITQFLFFCTVHHFNIFSLILKWTPIRF